MISFVRTAGMASILATTLRSPSSAGVTKPGRKRAPGLQLAASLAVLFTFLGCDGATEPASDTLDAPMQASTDAQPGSDDDAQDTPADAASSPDATPAPLRLYMAPDGDDERSGESSAEAVRSLDRIQEILIANPPARDVEVAIAAGTYRGQRVTWTFTMPDHRIVFRRADPDGERPVFDGCLSDGSCPGGTWFSLDKEHGTPSNLEFVYLRVTRYRTAISFNGDRNQGGTSSGANRIYGCYFDRIGNGFEPSLARSTAAVRLVNSDDNVIANNHFVDVINVDSGALIHAIYLAHGSERNEIARNRFFRSTGDPVRVRDYSNGNVIVDNRFIQVGNHAGYTEWYCDHDTRDDCTKVGPECPSWQNQFRDNTLDGTWTCDRLSTFEYFQDATATGCSPPTDDAVRLRTSGNEHTATPCSL